MLEYAAMNIKKHNPDNHLIKHSNELVEHCQMNFTAMEYRIMHAALSQVHKDDEVTDKVAYEIPLTGFADLIDRDRSGELYDAVLAAGYSMTGKKVKIKTNVDGSKRKKVLGTVIIQSIQYDEDTGGSIHVRFGRDAIPYLNGLQSHYTQYSGRDGVMQLTGRYAIRLYHLVARWGKVGKKELELSEFRWMMNCEDAYPRFGMFRTRVIEPAVREINEKTNIDVSVGYRKRSRRYTHVQFDIELKSKKKKLASENTIELHGYTITKNGSQLKFEHPTRKGERDWHHIPQGLIEALQPPPGAYPDYQSAAPWAREKILGRFKI